MKRTRVFLVALAVLLAGCRRSPDIKLPDWQPEIARRPEQWLADPAIQLLHDYVRIQTIDPPGNERPGAEFLKAYFDCEGVPAELICPEKDRCNVYARIRGRDANRGLLLLNHIDVVPVQRGGWTHDPFGGEINQSYLYGRGSYDMKSIAVAQMLAFVDLAKSGITPARDVVFLAECGEEYGWAGGVRWLYDHRPDVFAGVDCVLNEGGITEIVVGFPRYWGIEVGQGAQAYVLLSADRPEPLKRSERFRPLDLWVKPEPSVQQFFDAVADFRAPYFANAFRHPELLKAPEVRKWIPFQNLSLVTGGLLFTAPFSTSEIPGYDAPGRWDAGVVISLPVGFDAGPMLDGILRENVPPGVRIIHKEIAPVARCSPYPTADTRAIERALAAASPGIPVIPIVNAFSETTSATFRSRGIPAYGFTPFLIDPIDSANRHGNEERVFLPFFIRGLVVMRETVYELAAPAQ